MNEQAPMFKNFRAMTERSCNNHEFHNASIAVTKQQHVKLVFKWNEELINTIESAIRKLIILSY